MRVTKDILNPEPIEDSYTRYREARYFLVEDIDADAEADPLVRWRAMEAAGVPRLGEASPSRPLAKCLFRFANSTMQQTNSCIVRTIYEWNKVGPAPHTTDTIGESWIVRDETTLSQEQSELDGEFKPIQVEYTPPGGTMIRKTGRTPRQMPIRHLMAEGLVPRTLGARGVVGKVNADRFRDEDPGWWICTGYAFENVGSIFRITASMMARQWRDWSEFIIYYADNGQIPKDITDKAADIKTLMDKPYAEGQQKINGFTKVGQYTKATFRNYFPF